LSLINANQSKVNISKLIPGEYEFRLTVWDAKDLNSSAVVSVSVIQAKNLAPVANAGGDKTVTLPVNGVSVTSNYENISSLETQRSNQILHN